MAYFDSPKNKAKWNIELDALKKEKEDRKNGIISSRNEHKANVMSEGDHNKTNTEHNKNASRNASDHEPDMSNTRGTITREHVTYNELLAEERAEQKPRRFEQEKTAPVKTREVEKSTPSKSL